MSLSEWLSHREALLGLGSHDELADAAGVPAGVVQAIAARGNLQRVGRSARAYLARTLEVTVRDLESLAAGKTDWIADTRRVDWSRVTPDCLRISRQRPTIQTPELIGSPIERGIAIVGRIGAGGVAHFLDDNANNEGRRLPLRVRGAPDAFAMEASANLSTCPCGAALIFRGLPPGELREGELALVTLGDTNEHFFRRVGRRDGCSLVLQSETGGKEMKVSLETIVRAARVIGTFTNTPSGEDVTSLRV